MEMNMNHELESDICKFDIWLWWFRFFGLPVNPHLCSLAAITGYLLGISNITVGNRGSDGQLRESMSILSLGVSIFSTRWAASSQQTTARALNPRPLNPEA